MSKIIESTASDNDNTQNNGYYSSFGEVSPKDLRAIADINRIVINSKFMSALLSKQNAEFGNR